MNSVESKLKELILTRYKSLREFTLKIDMPYSTFDTILKRGVDKANIINILKICNELNISADKLASGIIENNSINYSQCNLSKEENQHILDFRALNDIGKKKVVTYTKDLLDNLKYQKNDEISATLVAEKPATYNAELPNKKKEIWEEEGKEHLMPVAAHMREGATEEDIQYDNDLMNDDSLWDD